jgi:Flp pilus assembly protein TadD
VELTDRIGDVLRLGVSGRSAVQGAQRRTSDFADLGRILNVRYVLEGSLRRSGTLVRISTRLLRTSDGTRVWGQTYDRTLTDILALQGEIASDVATSVTGQLFPQERAALTTHQTTNPDAWVHYLRGNFLITRRSADAFRQATDEYEAAIAADPRFAGALARLATVYVLQVGYGVAGINRDSLAARATRAADRALALDSLSSDGWMARAMVENWFHNRPYAARHDMERAVALDPRNAEAVHSLGVALQWLADDSLSRSWLRRALELDAGRAVTALDLGLLDMVTGHQASAEALLDTAIVLDPAMARTWGERALVRGMRGDLAGARSDAETGLRLASPGVRNLILANLVNALAANGDTATARARLAELDTALAPIPYARALISVGAIDHALLVLDRVERIPPGPTNWSELRYPEFTRVRDRSEYHRLFAAWRPRDAGP